MVLRGSRGDYPYDCGRHLIALSRLIVYCDESGIDQSSRFCIIGGYLGSPNQWRKFNKGWLDVLRYYEVPEFHAKDFFPAARRRFVVPYKDWPDKKSEAFLRALFSVVNQRNIQPLTGGIDSRAFREMPEQWRRYITGAVTYIHAEYHSDSTAIASLEGVTTGAPNHPYFAGFIQLIMAAAAETPKGAKVHFIFDAQNVLEGNAVQVFQTVFKAGRVQRLSDKKLDKEFAEKLGDITYSDSLEHPGLQAADLYSYTWHRVLEGKVDSDLLVTASNLIQEKSNRIQILTERSLRQIVQETDKDVRKFVQREWPKL